MQNNNKRVSVVGCLIAFIALFAIALLVLSMLVSGGLDRLDN